MHQIPSFPGVPSESPNDVVLMTGGPYTLDAEVYPSSSGCSIPPLPSLRYNHQTFLTSDPIPMVATCGGTADNIKVKTSCLVLDVANQSWDDRRLGDLTMPRVHGAVAVLRDIGVFYLGGMDPEIRSKTTSTSDFLAARSLQWTAGPTLPTLSTSMAGFCAVPITPTSFITIDNDSIFEFDASIAGPTSNEGWKKWPEVKTSILYFACAKIGDKVIISGGRRDSHTLEYGYTDILDITTRKIFKAGHRVSTRMGPGHALVTIRSGAHDKLFALGGLGPSARVINGTVVDTVEEWVEETATWKVAASLTRGRGVFGAVALPKDFVCQSK